MQEFASMKKVFLSQNLIEVEMRKERLEQARIQCMIKNQRSSSLAGEIPFTEVFPELWLVQDEDYDRARQLLEEGLYYNHRTKILGSAPDAASVTKVSLPPAGTAGGKGRRRNSPTIRL